ncbi:MAG: efflux RND transporter periplasmic adaptor subunit [Candidatus Neomarinimicrobiota bacterium]|nr:efflux RND transporter periplasmic adaptor subunit [Candidatus Neomarinimicrobiota bacterium]
MAKKNGKKKKIIIFSIIGVVILGIAGSFFMSKGEKLIVVTVETVTRQEIIQKVTGSGRIEPERTVELSANISALIMGISVEEGDSVMVGQQLISLDRTRTEAATEQASSRLKSARANLAKIRAIKNREERLFEEKLISSQELEAVSASFQAAEAEVLTSQAALKSAMDDLSKTSLLAPRTGIVTEIRKEEGEMALGSVFQADVIMSIADLAKMEVNVDVNENDVVSVSVGDSSEIDIDAFQDTIFYGVVTEIAHVAQTTGLGTQNQVTNYRVKVKMLQVPELIRPGMSATASIITDKREDALGIPIQSLTVRPVNSEKNLAENGESRKQGENQDSPKKIRELEELVFVLAKAAGGVIREGVLSEVDGVKEINAKENAQFVHLRPVKVGISSETHYEVLSGLEEGEEIVIGSYRAISKELSHNRLVTIANAEKDKEKSGSSVMNLLKE